MSLDRMVLLRCDGCHTQADLSCAAAEGVYARGRAQRVGWLTNVASCGRREDFCPDCRKTVKGPR